ncbi:uncharacterized protein [Halyomorpha halys]|uniref:uncharacterized protein n=1 Tax=Halyomorpha halys TaxID=286706 RepID=UPI0006D4EDE3|nr:uncharacterized protein LOC106683723 isoform X1 [Halyomorpha halys]
MFVNKMFLFCHKDDLNLIPVCISCCILFPVFLDHHGHNYLLLYVVAAFLFSKVISFTKKGDSLLVTSWLKLLCLTSGLAFACCGLGHIITDYESNEEATYHLFPTIPWLMPVTIPIFLSVLIALGLQPSCFLESTLFIFFTSLVFIFTILGVYKLTTIEDEIVITIKLNRIQDIPSGIIFFLQLFIAQSYRKISHIGMSLSWCLFLLSVIGILTALNEKHKCDGIISCLKTLGSWTEPITLALTISSLGLCLPDLFVIVQNYINKTPYLKKMLTITKARSSVSILIGVMCAEMVYLCSISTLIMISGSSIVLVSTIEQLIILLNIPIIDAKPMDSLYESAIKENVGYEDSENDDSSSGLSDSESTCSDISLIVAEYKAKIKIMGGDTNSTESKRKRMLFIYQGLVGMITVLGFFLAYSIQYLQLVMAIITTLGLVIFFILQQWVISRANIFDNVQRSEPKVILSYLVGIILLGGIPKTVWFYIAIWSAKGAIIYVIQKNRNLFYEPIQVKHILSIKQSPPVFQTTCDSSVQRKNLLNIM